MISRVMASALPRVESWIYIALYIGIHGYGIYCVYSDSIVYKPELNPGLFSKGLPALLLDRFKDVADFEWTFWTQCLWQLTPIYAAYVTLSRLVRWKLPHTKRRLFMNIYHWNDWRSYRGIPVFQTSFYLLFSLLAIWYVVGFQALLLLLTQCTIIYISSLTHSVIVVWATSIALLSVLNFEYTSNLLLVTNPTSDDPLQTNFYLQVFSLSMSNLRYTGFCLEKVWHEVNLLKTKTFYFKCRKSNNGTDVNCTREVLDNADTSKDSILSPDNNTVNDSTVEKKARGRTKETMSDTTTTDRILVSGSIETRVNEASTMASTSDEASVRSTSNKPTMSTTSQETCVTNDASAIPSGHSLSSFYAMLTGSSDQRLNYSYIQMLTYVLYFPLYFTGPVLIYPEFHKQLTTSQPSTASSKYISIFRMIFWWTFNDVVLYYFYFHAMFFNHDVLNKMSLWTLGLSGYCHGMFFMTKYVVMFGVPALIASYDNITAPKTPKCLSTIVMYSDIWKCFDRGLYSFLKRYIYIPVGGSRSGWKWQLFASFLTFIFIFYWHGAMWYLFVWSALNFLGICLEAASKRISRWSAVVNFEVRYLTPAWKERLYGLLTVPLYAMSVIAIFIFFGDTDVGMIYINRFILSADAVSLAVTILDLYCNIQTSSYITNWQAGVKQKTS